VPPEANSPARKIWSYESACAELKAAPLSADAAPMPLKVDFDADTVDQVGRVSARTFARTARLVAYPLAGLPGRPHVVAEFAGTLLLERRDGRLVPASPEPRLPYRDRANLQWIYWGELSASPTGNLALGPLSIAAWPGADTTLEPSANPYHGITTDVLRALKPAPIIRKVTNAIRNLDNTHRFFTEQYGWPERPAQRQLLDHARQRLSRPQRRRGRRYPDEHYLTIALLYLDLLSQGGQRNILSRLAEQLEIPKTTARDWVHRARQLQYLTPSRQGRPGAQPGPRLQQETD
jgi:hypothetical protein